jgi:subtilisin-like proprotein convertase family protein
MMNTAKHFFRIAGVGLAAICLLIAASPGSVSFAFVGSANAVDGKGEKEKSDPPSREISVINAEKFDWWRNTGKAAGPPATSVGTGIDFGDEVEPNGSPGSATALPYKRVRVRGNIVPNGDQDFYSFHAEAGDRVYAAVMTSYSGSGSTDSQLRLFATDGTTEIEFDDDDGSLGSSSSSIAGAAIPSAGTYFLRVNHFSATSQLRPYELYLSVQSGTPTAETESNDGPGTANSLPANGWVSGARDPAVATEQDWYAFTMNEGDTVYLGLDLDPERDNVQWNGRLGLGLFGDGTNQILVVDDGSTGSAANPLSEGFFMTAKNSGTYYAFVDSATAATGGPTATYNLSVSVYPRRAVGTNCTTYTSTDVPKVIADVALTSSTLTIPGNPRIASARLSIAATHTRMADLDVNLRSPYGNNNAIFNDIGASATGGQTMMDLTIDDYAGIPPLFTVVRPFSLKPELNYRLDYFAGEDAGGDWTLDVRDDNASETGMLNGWSLEICEQSESGSSLIFDENFEANDGGFTHSGTADEWQWGFPNTPATTTSNPVADFIGCNGGMGCWKTDLTGTYNVSSVQDLISPPVVLPGAGQTISLGWAMRYQMESATFDHARVIVTDENDAMNSRVVWEWNGATMTATVGSPATNVPISAGWGNFKANISDFAGKTVRFTFHLDSDSSINLGGLAIDDVQVKMLDNAAISGRVSNSLGYAIPRALVTLTDRNGNIRTARANNFGYYRFSNVLVANTYFLTARAKEQSFPTRAMYVTNNLVNENLMSSSP